MIKCGDMGALKKERSAAGWASGHPLWFGQQPRSAESRQGVKGRRVPLELTTGHRQGQGQICRMNEPTEQEARSLPDTKEEARRADADLESRRERARARVRCFALRASKSSLHREEGQKHPNSQIFPLHHGAGPRRRRGPAHRFAQDAGHREQLLEAIDRVPQPVWHALRGEAAQGRECLS